MLQMVEGGQGLAFCYVRATRRQPTHIAPLTTRDCHYNTTSTSDSHDVRTAFFSYYNYIAAIIKIINNSFIKYNIINN